MLKVRVLGLSGCHWCRALTGELDKLSIPYSFIDVDSDSVLADRMEALLETDQYPMTIVSNDTQALYYIFRPDNAANLGMKRMSEGYCKVGCRTIDSMLANLTEILEKY